MAIVKAEYAKSQTLYAIDWSSFSTIGERGHAWVEAIWTVTRRGVSQISMGVIGAWGLSLDGGLITPTNFMAEYSNGRGGTATARWDGSFMWSPKTTLAEMNNIAVKLDPILAGLPLVPPTYDGWFTLV